MLAAALCLAGCGYRGPLYIPGQPGDPAFDKQNRGARPTPPPSLPAPADPARRGTMNDKPGTEDE